MAQTWITSWAQLQSLVAELLEQINGDPSLALAAAANPIFALHELGYEIDSQVRVEIEHSFRFGQRITSRLRKLREGVIKQAGRHFDLDSATELRSVLFDELKITLPNQAVQFSRQTNLGTPDTAPLPPQLPWTDKAEDPLECFRKSHPIMEPLLEYRRLEASRPRLAPRHLYDQIRRGKRHLLINHVRGRLQSTPT